MATLINIHGPVAVGKSTTVEKLLPQLKNYVFIDRAYIKHHLSALGREERKVVSKKAVYLLLEQCIYRDANILTQELNPESLYRHVGLLLEKHKYRFLSFRLAARWETTIARSRARQKNAHEGRMRKIWDSYPQPSKFDIIIDTEQLSEEEVVERILAHTLYTV